MAALLPALHRPRVASLYRTAPLSPLPQPDYLNTAVVGESAAAPRHLLTLVHELERAAGRTRDPAPHPPAPRFLDIDLVWWDDLVCAEPDLVLPHPRARQRRFVLEPLAEIAPRHRMPPDGATVGELLALLLRGDGERQRVERLGDPAWYATAGC